MRTNSTNISLILTIILCGNGASVVVIHEGEHVPMVQKGGIRSAAECKIV